MRNFKLIIAIAFLFVGVQAMAQNGSNPFVNSTHKYKVTGAGGTFTWEVLNDAGATAAAANFEIKAGGDPQEATILWKTAGTYTVQLTELGANGCSTLRQFPVTVQANLFDIAIADLAADCSSASGKVINDDDSNLGTSTRTFTITASDIPDGAAWEFNVTAAVFKGAGTIAVNSASSTNATLADGKVSVSSGIEVKLDVTFNNTFAGGDVSLTLSNGKELKYNTPEAETKVDNNIGTATVKAMPATSKITTD